MTLLASKATDIAVASAIGACSIRPLEDFWLVDDADHSHKFGPFSSLSVAADSLADRVKPYSTDNAAALEAFERYVMPLAQEWSDGAGIVVEHTFALLQYEPATKEWSCGITQGDLGKDGWVGEASPGLGPTLPLAICHFILRCEEVKAKGGEW